MLKILLPIIITVIIFSALYGYLNMQGGDLLRYVARSSTKIELLSMRSTSTLIYWGGLLVLVGALTLVVLIGIILAIIGDLLLTVGYIVLGLEVRRWGREFDTPGLLIVIGSILGLLSIALGEASVLGYIVASILLMAGFYEARSALIFTARRAGYE